MTDNSLNYLGPIPNQLDHQKGPKPWWKRLPVSFLVVVALPTLIAAIYYLLIASPRYVSEARFIVRAANQSQPSSLGVALQGVGLSTGQTDAFAVHEYINSREAVRDLDKRFDLGKLFALPGVDAFSRYPRFWESRSQESLYKAYQRFVVVGYDSTTGISTLKVEGFRPRDAQQMSEALLSGGEQLVNRLNIRSAIDAVSEAKLARDQARERLAEAQSKLTAFRNKEEFLDPTLSARESSVLIGGLMATVANLRAERSDMVAQAPQNPQLPALDGRIAAFERQIAAERAKVAGGAGSLAPRVSAYEDLTMEREFADRELAQATAAVVASEQDARRQRLYLDRVVSPDLPDKAVEPRRVFNILTVFMTCMLAYGVGWLIWAGIREHKQD